MFKHCVAAITVCLVTHVPAQADELAEASQALCEQVKSCAMAQMEGEELTPQTRQMMQPMLDSMCAQVQSQVSNVPSGHPLYQPAVACMQSMKSLTCEMMQDGEQVKTPACEAYEKLAREAAPQAN